MNTDRLIAQIRDWMAEIVLREDLSDTWRRQLFCIILDVRPGLPIDIVLLCEGLRFFEQLNGLFIENSARLEFKPQSTTLNRLTVGAGNYRDLLRQPDFDFALTGPCRTLMALALVY